jgi:hypothetical protein
MPIKAQFPVDRTSLLIEGPQRKTLAWVLSEEIRTFKTE